MSEEEMKQTLLSHCKECHLREYASCVECEEKFTKATNEALNYIDKLQKENEELKEKYENINWYFENQKDNFVHKDKIKNKIKEITEETQYFGIDKGETKQHYAIKRLKELLGDDEA